MPLIVLKIIQEVENLKEALHTSCEELPLFLNAETLAQLLGVSVSRNYELMHEKDFPAIRIGSRLVVPKEKLQQWIDEKTGICSTRYCLLSKQSSIFTSDNSKI